jgi:hypothetical protein
MAQAVEALSSNSKKKKKLLTTGVCEGLERKQASQLDAQLRRKC